MDWNQKLKRTEHRGRRGSIFLTIMIATGYLFTFSFQMGCEGTRAEKASLPKEVRTPQAASGSSAPGETLTATQTAGASPVDASAEARADTREDGGLKAVDHEVDFRLVGEINAKRKSQLAFKVGGFIESVTTRPGVIVKKGEPLATLDQRDFKLRLDFAKAKREQAAVALQAADRELKRELELKSANASTESNLDRAKTSQDQARIALQLAELDLKQADNAMRDSRLTAPYDCIVATQLKYDGENVQSGTPAFEIYDTFEPEVILKAPEKLLGKVSVGDEVSVRVPAASYQGVAKIVRIVSVVNDKTRTFSLAATFNEPHPNLVPGLFVEGTIKKSPKTN